MWGYDKEVIEGFGESEKMIFKRLELVASFVYREEPFY